MKNLLTGLFRAARKALMTVDNDMGMFREKLNELVYQKDALSDEEIAAKVEELKSITADLPDDEGKEKLVRFLEDFKAVKEQDPAVAKKAAESVAEEFEKLDAAAMQDVPGGNVPAEESVEEPVPDEGETVAEEVAEETVAEEKPLEEDADPNAEYTLEEIYQFIKKRMAEDAEPGTEEELAEEEIGEEKDEEEVVTDHAPHIPVTVNANAGAGSLASLFNMAKGDR